MNEAIRRLEAAARAAFNRGDSWGTYWEQHAAEIRSIDHWCRHEFHRLRDRLLSLCLSGDCDGLYPISAPFGDDDEAL